MVTIVMTTQMECDTLLVCIGRKPYTDGLGLEVCPGYYLVSIIICLCCLGTGHCCG